LRIVAGLELLDAGAILFQESGRATNVTNVNVARPALAAIDQRMV